MNCHILKCPCHFTVILHAFWYVYQYIEYLSLINILYNFILKTTINVNYF